MWIQQVLRNASVLWMTLLYVAFCVATFFGLPPCLDSDQEKCNSEGYDNSVLSWSTNFFVGALFVIMSISLGCCCCCKSTSWSITSGMAFGFLSMVFLSRGFVGVYFPNSGLDDGHGQVGFYLLTLASYSCWTISSVFFLSLTRVAWDSIQLHVYHVGQSLYKIFFGLMVCCFVIITTSCVWNALALWQASDSSVDEYTQDDTGNFLPIWLLRTSVLLWNIFYCAFVAASTYAWRVLAKQRSCDIKVTGLSSSMAAVCIAFLQMTNAMIILLLHFYTLANRTTLNDQTANSIASIIFNLSALLTGYLMFGFLLVLFPNYKNAEKALDTDSDTEDEAVHVPLGVDDKAGIVEEEQSESNDGDLEEELVNSADVEKLTGDEEEQKLGSTCASLTQTVQFAFNDAFAFASFLSPEQPSEKVEIVVSVSANATDTMESQTPSEGNAMESQTLSEDNAPPKTTLEEC
ncbi:hypothetical protein IV203_009907 [Nitzschia inconspicua]|uniref:Uncharacterized protein n=1 Tax=Nitzschia inconspicua TaxID=303405 RepID=A0A9K3PJZ1_9STRA|nr:hypothetical protein IV203_009907 [Nitzschia inconspicua]